MQKHFIAVLAALAAAAGGCTGFDVDRSAGTSIGSSTQELQALDWSGFTAVPGPASWIAATGLGANLYVVTTDASGNPTIAILNANHTLSSPVAVPGLTAGPGAFALQAFAGNIFLLSPGSTAGSLLLSRFDPQAQAWTTGLQLPFTSASFPSMTVFQNQLFIAGISENLIYVTAMAEDGSFSAAQFSTLHGRDVSIATFGTTLRLAFTSTEASDAPGTVRVASFDGSTFSPASTVSGGFGPGVLIGTPTLSRFTASQDCLNLMVAPFGFSNQSRRDTSVRWTYICGTGTSFVVPVAIPHAATQATPVVLGADSTKLHLFWGATNTVGTPQIMFEQTFAFPGGGGTACTPGQPPTCVDNHTVQTCDASGNLVQTACTNQACVNGACVGTCSPTQGPICVNDHTVQTCNASGNPVQSACVNQACVGGACVGSCTPGALMCSTGNLLQCNSSGVFVVLASCAGGCSGTTCCSSPPTCDPEAECGTATNACGQTVSCGTCTANKHCDLHCDLCLDPGMSCP